MSEDEETVYEFEEYEDKDEEENHSVISSPIKPSPLSVDEIAEEKSKLTQELEDLKYLFEVPRLYLSNFFVDLKRDIDLASLTHASNLNKDNAEQTNMLNRVWVDIIKRVDLFEKDCLQKFRSNQFSADVANETVEAITQIDSKIQTLMTKEDVIELNELIYEKTYLLEKIIFNDRTITFVNKAKCKLCEIFNEMDVKITFGKLIIVHNYYFGKRGLNFLTKKFYTKENFPKLTNELLKSLNLKEMLLSNLTSDHTDEITLDFKLKTINYSYESIKSIDLNAFQDLNSLTSIFLIGNHITSLDPSLFNSLLRLERIYFDSNKLKSLDINIFKGLTELKEIYLSGNPLASDNFNFFKGLINLVSIDLSWNQIVSLESPDIFHGLVNLKKISLGNNQIKSLDPKTFQGLNNLTEIWLNDNQLESLDSNLFRGLTQLIRLDLDNNQLSSLKSPLLKDLTQLVWFNMSGNQVKHIDPDVFEGLTQLTHICLNGNEISELDPRIFHGLVKIQYINLHFNQLESLDPSLFSNLVNLTRIDLSKNQLSTLSPNIFSGLESLYEVKLSYNPFVSLDTTMFKTLRKTSIVEMHGVIETETLNPKLFQSGPVFRWRQRQVPNLF